MTTTRTIILGAALAAVALTGCSTATESGQAPSTLPYADLPALPSTTLIDHKPDIELTELDERLTTFEAELVCERGQTSFESAAAIEAARDSLLAVHGLSYTQYADFKAAYDENRDLRDMVLYKYSEVCA